MQTCPALEILNRARSKRQKLALWLCCASFIAHPVLGQTRAATTESDPCKPGYSGEAKCDDATKAAAATALPAATIKLLDTFIKDKTKIDGLFTIYRDDATGKHFMQVRDDQIGQEFIYFSYVQNGSANPQSRLSGTLRDNAVFRLRKTMNRIDFLLSDTEFELENSGPMSRLQGRNVPSPLITTEVVVASSSDQKTHLIDVSKVFSRNAFVRFGGGIGGATLNSEDSLITDVRNYPTNLEIIGEHVLRSATATSARTASEIVRVQHTILPMPEPGFEPRLADPRVGFFTSRKTDLTAIEGLPIRDVILRWRLTKKDPAAAVSAPIVPIVFWIENTTPLEYRQIITDAVKSWNGAFLQAGISDAIDVKVQPDNATWDAGDARYHVLKWNASPQPRYLGYGPTFSNPRTGEILGADIVLEHSSLARSIRTDRLYQSHNTTHSDHGGDHDSEDENCVLGHELAIGLAYGAIATQIGQGVVFKDDRDLRQAIITQGLKYLVIHEVGHTLGLTHNMMGTAAVPLRTLSGPGSKSVQPSASVMDYPAINIASGGAIQGKFFPDDLGPYDIWAIRFGYDDRLKSPASRAAHLARSTEPSLRLGNDADAVSSADRGIDPRVNTFDLSDDPIGFGEQQIKLVWQTMPKISSRLARPGDTHEESVGAFRLLLSMIERSGISAARHIGGVHVERTIAGQLPSQRFPHTPVSEREQRRAMSLLTTHLFAPDAFVFSPELLGGLQRYRRGFELGSGLTRQDVTIHAQVRSVQAAILTVLLHDRTLRRISDTGLYGNSYSVHAILRDLTASVFAADLNSEVNSFRRNLQVEYVRQISGQWRSGRLDAQSEAALLGVLERIQGQMLGAEKTGSTGTQAHRRYVLRLVKEALEPNPAGR